MPRSVAAPVIGNRIRLCAELRLIAVAHRILTLKGADRIIVLEQGRITAEGTYDELLESSATFRKLAGVEG
jgi:ABC-type multidrug transport system fused ATPase/permease subunit